MEEELPVITIVLSLLMVASYLFTSSNLKYYEYLLGFVPARPNIFSLLTYTFIHIDVSHLAGNIIVLIIMGLAIEKHVGKMPFISIYISSGCVAATFDILSRLLLGISMNLPFVGSSGSIFGLLAVTSLTRPMEKIPTLLVVLALLPLLEFVIGLPVLAEIVGEFSETNVFLTIMLLLAPILVLVMFVFPATVPVFVAALLFIFSWAVLLVFRLPTSTSNLGHLGGLLGGFICMFAFPKEKKT
jgi:membrane associated rhomboid family serine protease